MTHDADSKLVINATNTTPEVFLDAWEGVIHIKGRCIPYNAFDFFTPLLGWVESYIQNPAPLTLIELYFEFINAHSALQLKSFLERLNELPGKGFKVQLLWLHDHGDIFMPELAENLLPFRICENFQVKILPNSVDWN